MASDVIVPEVGEVGMDVVFVRWLKAEGDEVAVGDPLFEVDTEKSVMEVEAYADGILTGLRVGEGDLVATRQVIAQILAPGETAATEAPSAEAPPAATPAPQTETSPPGGSSGAAGSSSAAPATGPSSSTNAAGAEGRGLSPRARRIAKELGVDPAGVTGSGPDGLVTEADIRAAAAAAGSSAPAASTAAPEPASSDADAEQADRARRAIADLTTRSWQSIPHFYLQLEADIGSGLELARPTPLICAAVAQALTRHPECNLGWTDGRPAPRTGVDLGLLVDAPAGLLIAVIKDAQDLGLAEMADAVKAAADRARSGTLSTLDLGPRSLTISNLGMFAVDRFAAVIPTPDVLTLAVGRSRTTPRWDGSAFEPRTVVDLTLSVDHRALDGAVAARLMSSLESILADPTGEGLA